MRLVARAGILCGALTIATAFSAAAELDESIPEISPAKSAPSAAAGSLSDVAQSAAAPPVNPLREMIAPPSLPTEPIFVALQPSAARVPNTGRVQLFRSTQKPVTETGTPAAQADGRAKTATSEKPAATSAFPSGVPKALSGMVLRESRYEDVARGPVLVPVVPPQSVQKPAAPPAPSTATKEVPQAIAPAVSSGAAKSPVDNKITSAPAAPTIPGEAEFKRLPPVTRTGPPPLLRPGTKLPQEPILIYPATGK